MNKVMFFSAIAVVAALASAPVQAKDGPTLRIENKATKFMVRQFDNGELCSNDNRGKLIGLSGRERYGGGSRRENLEIDITPGQPFEIVLADSVAAGGRFRIEPEAGVDYLARLRRDGDTVWLGLHSRPHGSDEPFRPLANAPVAAHADDVCPHARWARIDFETPARSAPTRERISPTLRNELLHEQRQLEAFGG